MTRRFRRLATSRRILAGAFTLALTLALLVQPAAAVEPTFFGADSVWNRTLAPDQKIDKTSDARVAELNRQVSQFGTWINHKQWSTPLYIVPGNTPKVKVTIDNPSPTCCPVIKKKSRKVPIPAGAQPANGGDRHITIFQPSTNKLWEYWQYRNTPTGPVAEHGGFLSRVSTSKGIIRRGEGATASGLPVIAGTILLSEAQAGEIPHALAMAVPQQLDGWVWPAQRTDGAVVSPPAGVPTNARIPMGSRFRLPASLNIDAQPWHPFTKMLARAAQKHGIVVRDQAGAVTLYAEQPLAGTNADVWTPIFGTPYPSVRLAEFPWDQLQLIKLGRIKGT